MCIRDRLYVVSPPPSPSPLSLGCSQRIYWKPSSNSASISIASTVQSAALLMARSSFLQLPDVTLIAPPRDKEKSSEISFKRWWRRETEWTLWCCFLLNTGFLSGCMICITYYIRCFMFSYRFVCFGYLQFDSFCDCTLLFWLERFGCSVECCCCHSNCHDVSICSIR